MELNGKAITERLRQFNNWRDDTLIDASTLLLMIGFIMGTFDLLTRIGIATSPWFTGLWAIVQALAIDGLFFAVWAKVARFKWAKATWLHGIAIVAVGLLLAIVAILVNAVLSLQQLTGIADSLQAMAMLHISSIAFVWARAILVVTVALLVQLFCRGNQGSPSTDSPSLTITNVAITEERSPVKRSHSHKKATVIDSHNTATVAIPEHASIDRSLENVAHSPNEQGYVACEETTDTHHMAIVATGNQGYRERIKATWLRYIEEGRDIQLTEIARDADVGYSTVKKWAASIRAEIEREG
jgi:signal transduction histidine kinase